MVDWLPVIIAVYASGAVVSLQAHKASAFIFWRIWAWRSGWITPISMSLGMLVSVVTSTLMWPASVKRMLSPSRHKKCGDLKKEHYFYCPCCNGYVAPNSAGAPAYVCCPEVYQDPASLLEYLKFRACASEAMPWAYSKCERCERPRAEHDLECPACGRRMAPPKVGATLQVCCDLTDPQLEEFATNRFCRNSGIPFEGEPIGHGVDRDHFIVDQHLGGVIYWALDPPPGPPAPGFEPSVGWGVDAYRAVALELEWQRLVVARGEPLSQEVESAYVEQLDTIWQNLSDEEQELVVTELRLRRQAEEKRSRA